MNKNKKRKANLVLTILFSIFIWNCDLIQPLSVVSIKNPFDTTLSIMQGSIFVVFNKELPPNIDHDVAILTEDGKEQLITISVIDVFMYIDKIGFFDEHKSYTLTLNEKISARYGGNLKESYVYHFGNETFEERLIASTIPKKIDNRISIPDKKLTINFTQPIDVENVASFLHIEEKTRDGLATEMQITATAYQVQIIFHTPSPYFDLSVSTSIVKELGSRGRLKTSNIYLPIFYGDVDKNSIYQIAFDGVSYPYDYNDEIYSIYPPKEITLYFVDEIIRGSFEFDTSYLSENNFNLTLSQEPNLSSKELKFNISLKNYKILDFTDKIKFNWKNKDGTSSEEIFTTEFFIRLPYPFGFKTLYCATRNDNTITKIWSFDESSIIPQEMARTFEKEQDAFFIFEMSTELRGIPLVSNQNSIISFTAEDQSKFSFEIEEWTTAFQDDTSTFEGKIYTALILAKGRLWFDDCGIISIKNIKEIRNAARDIAPDFEMVIHE